MTLPIMFVVEPVFTTLTHAKRICLFPALHPHIRSAVTASDTLFILLRESGVHDRAQFKCLIEAMCQRATRRDALLSFLQR